MRWLNYVASGLLLLTSCTGGEYKKELSDLPNLNNPRQQINSYEDREVKLPDLNFGHGEGLTYSSVREKYFVYIENGGEVVAEDINWKIVFEDMESGEKKEITGYIDRLKPDGSMTYFKDNPLKKGGACKATTVVDPENKIKESNEENNHSETIIGLPDLYCVTGYVYDAGDNVFCIHIENIGDRPAEDVEWEFIFEHLESGKEKVFKGKIKELNLEGLGFNFFKELPPQEGFYEIRARADPGNKIREFNEKNNKYEAFGLQD